MGYSAVCRLIAVEVSLAIAEGRMAKHFPRWAVRAGTSRRSLSTSFRGRLQPSVRFVWTADERRLYTIDRHASARLVVVLTCIRPDWVERDEAA